MFLMEQIQQHEWEDYTPYSLRHQICKYCDLCYDKISDEYFTRNGEEVTENYPCITRQVNATQRQADEK